MIENVCEIKNAIEAILFVAADPVPISAIKEIFSIYEDEAEKIIDQLKAERENSGILLRRVDDGYQFCTNPDYYEYVKRLIGPQRQLPLSQAALETLSIIAYKQPVTRADIENIRGVKSSSLVTALVEKGLIEKVGVKDTLGHPALLGTTKEFLIHFGLETLDDLPSLEELPKPIEHEI